MTSSNLPPRLSTGPQNPADLIALEIDVQTALALARAATRAIKEVSTSARATVKRAVEAEIDLLVLRDGVVPQIVVAMLREEISEAA